MNVEPRKKQPRANARLKPQPRRMTLRNSRLPEIPRSGAEKGVPSRCSRQRRAILFCPTPLLRRARLPWARGIIFPERSCAGEGAGRAIDVESHLKMQVALIMQARAEVVHLEPQVPVAWSDAAGRARKHFFDFRILLRDGTRVALIVMRAGAAQDRAFRRRVAQITAAAIPEIADRVCVMTDRHVDPIELHNATLLASVRNDTDPPVDAAARRLVAPKRGAVPIGTLVETLGVGGRGFRAILRLLHRHELDLARPARISPDAFVKGTTD